MIKNSQTNKLLIKSSIKHNNLLNIIDLIPAEAFLCQARFKCTTVIQSPWNNPMNDTDRNALSFDSQ